jgi:predicted 2-oxoglutarate/Fe(II)-dependent dioxygenase YbiX
MAIAGPDEADPLAAAPAAIARDTEKRQPCRSERFEGGELRFPEYGGLLYSPATGEAIAFSSSILHEPLGVTSGTRFALLSFLFGET